MTTLVLVVAAYLAGSVSTAIHSSRLLGLPDPRAAGSGNPGATNVLRLGSKQAAIITLLGDAFKGFLPVLLGRVLHVSEAGLAGIGIAAFLGHLFPIYYGFKGGKGVATALGVLLAFDWIVGLLTLGTWLLVAAISRVSSLSALTATLVAPLYVHWRTDAAWLTAATVAIGVLVFWRHRSNIRQLIKGTEARIGQK